MSQELKKQEIILKDHANAGKVELKRLEREAEINEDTIKNMERQLESKQNELSTANVNLQYYMAQ